MTVWKPPNNFAQALREAQEFEDFSLRIHWCPWIERDKKLDAEGFYLVPPEEAAYSFALKNLAGSGWDQSILKTVLHLIFKPGPDRGKRLKVDSERHSLPREPLNLRSYTKNSYFYIADINRVFSRQPHMFDFLTQKGTAQMVIGLWQGMQKPFRWLPEISVCRGYNKSDLASVDLEDLLATFSREMKQEAIFLRIGVATEEHGWLFVDDEFIYKGLLNCWQLHCRVNGEEVEWIKQTSHLLEALTQAATKKTWRAWDSEWKKTVQEHVLEAEMQAAHEAGENGLGVTFAGGSTGVLNVFRSGSPRFLFEPFFEPVLQSRPELAHDKKPILLDSDKKDDLTREVSYTLYCEDPRKGRCLCGKQYPEHPSQDCPEIARLRGSRIDWIRECYSSDPDQRGQRWPWELLSSPYFYFCEDPESLLQDPNGTMDRQLRKKSVKKWREVMNEMYGTGAVGELDPEKP